MDRFSENQARINQLKAEASANYPRLWTKTITEWNSSGADDRVWLTYSANYLFRTNNIHWAIDPVTLTWRIKDTPNVNGERDLGNLSFVLLTHRHADHLDLDLLSELRHLPITWVVPEFLLPLVTKDAGLLRQNIVSPAHLEPIELNGIHILPFDGLHWETTADGGLKGVPAMGYLIEFNNRRWLFPGDTRTYDISQIPSLDSADILFAHLWLGRGSALCNEPPLLDAFCRFFLNVKPRRIVLTHLHEFGRDANDFWDESHVEAVRSKFQELSVDTQVSSTFMGGSVLL
jgi:L-ascorbate metabolism protein UlaG (beta-lactamase superfamily)